MITCMITYVSCFCIALCIDVFWLQDRIEEVPQLPLSDEHLGGGEEETKDGDVGAEREDDEGRKVRNMNLIRRCKVIDIFINCFFFGRVLCSA